MRPGKVTTYKVEEWDGTFYAQDLQKVTVEDDDLFRIDKIVKRKGDKVLVRWKGWPVKYDSWLDKKDVLVKKKKKVKDVQLLSNASTSEFPDNKVNSFKNRLPYPLTFDADKEWKVGLVSVSYPIPPSRPHQVPVHQSHDFDDDDTLLSIEWTIETFLRQSDGSWLPGRYRVPFHVTGKELNRDRHKVTSGRSLMQYLINRFTKECIIIWIDQVKVYELRTGKNTTPCFDGRGMI